MQGRVKFFSEQKGFGFIVPDDGSKDIFVHASGLLEGLRNLPHNAIVDFKVRQGKKGSEAFQVKCIG